MRKTKEITIPGHPENGGTSNRDGGKKYRITEMSARAAEDWVVRAMLAINAAGMKVADDDRDAGAAGAMSGSLDRLKLIRPEDARPLLDEMMGCVDIFDAHHKAFRPLLEDDDIEEIATRVILRSEVVELHTGFPAAATLSYLGAAAKRAMTSPATSTSPSTSEPSSAAA